MRTICITSSVSDCLGLHRLDCIAWLLRSDEQTVDSLPPACSSCYSSSSVFHYALIYLPCLLNFHFYLYFFLQYFPLFHFLRPDLLPSFSDPSAYSISVDSLFQFLTHQILYSESGYLCARQFSNEDETELAAH